MTILALEATQACSVFQCVEVCAIDADPRTPVSFYWRGLVYHFCLLWADGESEGLGCIENAVDDVS